MLRLTFSQLRHSARRLISAGLAVAIGAAFVAATLVAGEVLDRASVDALSADFGDADLVVEGSKIDLDRATAIDELDVVAQTHGVVTVFLQVEGGGTRRAVPVTPAATDPTLTRVEFSSGTSPERDQIVLTEGLADTLNVGVGDKVPILRMVRGEDGDGDVTFDEVLEHIEVSGLLHAPPTAFAATGVALGDHQQVLEWAAAESVHGTAAYERLLVRVDPDVLLAEALDEVAAVDGGLMVSTREEYAHARAADLTGGNIVTVVGLAFAAVALLVAAFVIANTFAVVVVQRTRTLAVLRCIGADRRQLRRSVLIEAVLLATVAALVGITIGLGLAQATLSVLAAIGSGLPTTISVSPAVFLVPLVVSLIVTTVAALVPARAAGRVAPLAAMRPTGAPDGAGEVSRRRKVIAVGFILAGLALLMAGVAISRQGDPPFGLLFGVAGGGLSAIGFLALAVWWVPRLLGVVATMVIRRGGPSASLAAANSVRNPRRTAATSSALLIGVTLVAMMSSGGSIARASFDSEFDRAFPVDVEILPFESADGPTVLPAERMDALRGLEGVGSVAPTWGVTLQVGDGDQISELAATGVDPAQMRLVVRDEAPLAGLEPTTVSMPEHLARALGVEGEQTEVTLAVPDGDVRAGGVELTVTTRPVAGSELLISRAALDRFNVDVPISGAWVRFEDGAEVDTVVDRIEEAVAEENVLVRSGRAERDAFDQIVSTMLRVVTGLLGVAVVIAVIGVGNTLSLSVIERRRELATLRAIGLTRRQLRRSLAIEAMLITGVGAVIGCLLGVFYGYLGSVTVLGELATGVPLAVPWGQLAMLIGVALLAGIASSVLPSRRAARTSPVAALAAQ